MKVLVTGATGFLGRLVARRLQAEGDRVRVLVRRELHEVEGAEIFRGDLRRAQDIRAAVSGMDAVIHCGAKVDTSGPWSEFAATNVDATALLIDAAARAQGCRVVHVSSLSVYGVPRDGFVVTEETPYDEEVEERGFYARSKLEADRLAMEAARSGAPVTVIRPGLLYGPGRPPPLARKWLRTGPVCFLLGSPDYLLPLTYGEHAADALVRALRSPHAVGKAFTVVDPQVPLKRYLRLYRQAYRCRWIPVFIRGPWLAGPLSALERVSRAAGWRVPVRAHQVLRATRNARYDCRRAQELLGWSAQVPLHEALRRSCPQAAGGGAEGRAPDRR